MQKGSIVGNVVAKNDINKTVLGYFEVSGVNSLRTFFSFSDLDDQFSLPYFRYVCNGQPLVKTTEDSIAIYMNLNTSLQIMDVNLESDPQATMGTDYCMDCSSYGSLIKPDYWTD
ncbi:hypothetical protein N7E81_08930 [Reichenbachiella carrageenanivorans]|uniref:Uncharacterized protein n=1 Tax=Reichenbachiella carrageenanivorans TaxID=2979869 RepID=A0ABY6D546_9BACT|nr:hypothetical protein [Reichenbachiella carrageenanivorans]UXX81218.1 hypothetical protein N7E81_08930 [Reichenbachiella carrageenanivorans]